MSIDDIWYHIFERMGHRSRAALAFTCRDMLKAIDAFSPLSTTCINWDIALSSNDITHNCGRDNVSINCVSKSIKITDIDSYLNKTKKNNVIWRYVFVDDYINVIDIFSSTIQHKSNEGGYLNSMAFYSIRKERGELELIKSGDLILIIDGDYIIYSHTATSYGMTRRPKYNRKFSVEKLKDARTYISEARDASVFTKWGI